MKLTVILLLTSIGIFWSCKKDNLVPDCMQSQIEVLKNSPCQTGASIKEYKFQGAIVYVCDVGNCISDGSASVIDQNCHYLGELGGIMGNTKINGVEFSTAVYLRTIWSN